MIGVKARLLSIAFSNPKHISDRVLLTMGKKSKSGSGSGKLKLTKKTIDPSFFPDPLPPLEDEVDPDM